jgi:hypothetical protein
MNQLNLISFSKEYSAKIIKLSMSLHVKPKSRMVITNYEQNKNNPRYNLFKIK